MTNAEAVVALESLKDLEGIVGSFFVSHSGGIVAQDLPSYFGSAAYDVGPRTLRLREAMDLSGGELDHCILRYGQHKLSLKPVGDGILTILCSASVNAPALRMATNLVARKLGKIKLTESPGEAPPTARPPAVSASGSPTERSETDKGAAARSAAAPEAADGRPATQKRALYFRGKRVR